MSKKTEVDPTVTSTADPVVVEPVVAPAVVKAPEPPPVNVFAELAGVVRHVASTGGLTNPVAEAFFKLAAACDVKAKE